VQFVDVDANIAATLKRPEPLPFGSPLLRKPRGSAGTRHPSPKN
jgi:hypothetical protein